MTKIENLRVYMATIVTDEEGEGKSQAEVIVSARNLAGIESFLKDKQTLTRATIMTDWVLADQRESYSGDYFMVDVIYHSEVTRAKENVIYLIRAENFTEIEDIAREEAGDSFEFIQSVEVIPHQVLQ